jgi:hypothetical protein
MNGEKYQELTRKLERIEALYRRATTSGERQAAALAMQRIRFRIESMRKYENAVIRKPVLTVFA